jgi:hypothetical protein
VQLLQRLVLPHRNRPHHRLLGPIVTRRVRNEHCLKARMEPFMELSRRERVDALAV